jgi:mRNA interferase RelE/StbE
VTSRRRRQPTPTGQPEQPAGSRRSGRHPQAQLAVVRLTDPAVEDLHALLRLDPQIVRWALKKMLLLERDPEAGEILHGELIGFRKLVVGDRDWRIVWRVSHDDSGAVIVDVAEAWAVGARSAAAVYAEMRARVAQLAADQPATVALAETIDRLGRIASDITPTPEPAAPVSLPDWLVDRLHHQVGLTPDHISSLSLEQAVDAWTAWSATPR